MTRSNIHGPHLVSPICKVRWAGWEASTLGLQDHGWEISAEQDWGRNQIRLAIHHPAYRIYGFSNPLFYEEFQDLAYNAGPLALHIPPFTMQYMASRMQVNVIDDFSRFLPIDAEPQVIQAREIKNIDDFNIFRTVSGVPEVVVEPATVPEMLEMILKHQSPKQAEIREKRRKELKRGIEHADIPIDFKGYPPAVNYIAQVVTIR